MPEERKLIEFCISHLDSAILKSIILEEIWALRGVPDLSWLNTKIGTIFTEKAYGSFSLDRESALKYTLPEKQILFHLKLNKGTKALYIDEIENEILLPRNMTYLIRDISIMQDINTETKLITIEVLNTKEEKKNIKKEKEK